MIPHHGTSAGRERSTEKSSDLVRRVLHSLHESSADSPGVTRDAYGAGEAAAHAIVRADAVSLGADVSVDAAGNLFMTLPGADRSLPGFMTGSHLDSVPHGGNFDGAAGVIAGLAAMAALRESCMIPPQDFTVVAFRAEEAAWFPISYPGSMAALGKLDPDLLNVPRSDTGRSLAAHMAEAGFDVDAVRRGVAHIRPDMVAAFVEVHIEQGPVLVGQNIPVGLVTTINGGFRHMNATVTGEWAHSGATPFSYRQDAAVAFAELVVGLNQWWESQEVAGIPLTITFGKVWTDPNMHAGSRVAGEVQFSVDVRAGSSAVLAAAADQLSAVATSISSAHGVKIAFGPRFEWSVEEMDSRLLDCMEQLAANICLPVLRMPSGAGHDAAAMAAAGIPAGMIFVRNANGSHNPDEAMDAEDLDLAVALLALLASTPLAALLDRSR